MSVPNTIDIWQPGDGLMCHYVKRAPVGLPCGRPVATIRTEQTLPSRRRGIKKHVVCAMHLPGREGAGSIAQRATTAAREQVLADHWEEYNALRDRLIEQYAEESMEQLPEELRVIARQAATS